MQGHHDFHDQRRGQPVAAGRMVAVAVAGESAGDIETRMTLGDQIQQPRRAMPPSTWATT